MQYMADTASVELLRNCQEDGMLRQYCKGKQDRERIIRELICPRERAEAQRINDITNSHFKSLQIINSIQTDNNENNDIALMPIGTSFEPSGEFLIPHAPTEKNTVQRLIEQFNVDELMQGDEPASLSGFKIPGEIPKPVKKAAKKYTASIEYPKKENTAKQLSPNEQDKQFYKKTYKPASYALDDMMMGDQGEPEIVEHMPDDEVSNEILEPLPHRKKILPQDLKTMPTITEKPVDMTYKQLPTTNSATFTDARTTLVTPVVNFSPDAINEAHTDYSTITTTTTKTTTTSGLEINTDTPTAPAATVIHPIHPQQPHGNIFAAEAPHPHPHIKETLDNSHFIPPMLLVKSHYVPPGKNEHEHQMHLHALPLSTTTATKSQFSVEPLTSDNSVTFTMSANDISVSTTKLPETTSIAATTTTQNYQLPAKKTTDTKQKTIPKSEETTTSSLLTTLPTNNKQAREVWQANTNSSVNMLVTTTTPTPTIAKVTVPITTPTAINVVELTQISEKADAHKSSVKINNVQPTIVAATTSTTFTTLTEESAESAEQAFEQRITTSVTDKTHDMEARVAAALAAASKLGEKYMSQQQLDAQVRTTATTATSDEQQKMFTKTLHEEHDKQETVAVTTDGPMTTPRSSDTTINRMLAETSDDSILSQLSTTTATTTEADGSTTRENFLLKTTVMPYKPKRRRMLTKSKSPSYIQKILG